MPTFRWFCAVFLVCGGICLAQVPAPDKTTLELSLEKAIEIATSTQGNASVQLAGESVHFAHSRYTEVRADLLPRVWGTVLEQNQTINLQALGVQFPPSPLFTVPHQVGPYYIFDARPRLTLSLLNIGAIRRSQAARSDVRVAEAESDSAHERVAGVVARLYAAALRANADVETAKMNVSLAEALRDVASHRESVGEATGIDTTRAELSVARNQQKFLAAQTALTRANLDLISALNLGWNTNLKLTGQLGTKNTDTVTPEQAMEAALKSRADFALQRRKLESAQLSHSAARFERFPSAAGYADYGILSGVLTHTVGVTLTVPLFDSRVDALRAEASSLVRQEEIRERDLKNHVELEVWKALATLSSAQSQIQVAERAVGLAEDELGRARRRYEAGLANNADVVDAEVRLENARNDRTAALYDSTAAYIDLAVAMGTIKSINF